MLCVHCARRLLSPSSNSNFGLIIHLERPDQRLQAGAFVVCLALTMDTVFPLTAFS